MSRSPTTRLRSDAEFQVGHIPAAYSRFWLPAPDRDLKSSAVERAAPIAWNEVFGTVPADGLELEIGCGKGLFLTQQAKARPLVHFIGVEWAWKFALLAARRIDAAAVTNVRLISCDATALFNRFATSSLSAIHVLFPDPWWKRRHRKRRMIDDDNVAEFARMLRPDGRLLLATDVAEYFAAMKMTLARNADFVLLPHEAWPGPAATASPQTHFARKYLEQGRELYFAGYTRRPPINEIGRASEPLCR